MLRDGRFETALLVRHMQSVAESAEAAVIGLDIPVGLPTFGQRRLADRLARARIGRRGSSVFATASAVEFDEATTDPRRLSAPSRSTC